MSRGARLQDTVETLAQLRAEQANESMPSSVSQAVQPRGAVIVMYQLCTSTGRSRVIAGELPHDDNVDAMVSSPESVRMIELPMTPDAVSVEPRPNDDPSAPVIRYRVMRGAASPMSVDAILYKDASGMLRVSSSMQPGPPLTFS